LSEIVLIIASSGRMLAQAARQSNLKPIVFDLYADQDTLEIAEKVVLFEQFSLASIQLEFLRLITNYSIKSVVYGSGLEQCIDVLSWLESQCDLRGNSALTHLQYSESQQLFQVLQQLGINYPEVCYSYPQNSSCYLIKSIQQAGGLGVRFCDEERKAEEYYQKFQQGLAGSVLFLAAKQDIQIIGFHRQWTVSSTDFSFAGIIKQDLLPKKAAKQVTGWVMKLTEFYALKGLNSLDFIWDGLQCYFLELNLRPPASLMLYPEVDLFSAHTSEEMNSLVVDSKLRALQVVYAVQDCRVDKEFKWPDWSCDRPQHGIRIKSGQPICSIMADGEMLEQLEKQLQNRQKIILNNVLIGTDPHAIHSKCK